MDIAISILGAVVFILLTLLRSSYPVYSNLSAFELRRRKKMGDKQAEWELRREELLVVADALKAYGEAALIVLLVASLIFLLGQARGVATSLLLIIVCGQLARLSVVRRLANYVAGRYEAKFLNILANHKRWLAVIAVQPVAKKAIVAHSREELMHIIASAKHDVLSEEDKRLLRAASEFKSRRVDDIMTSVGGIVSVDKDELLGPLVLNDLHKTGHSRFPVTDGSIQNIVGVLDISSLLALEVKHSVSAKKAMTTKVPYSRPDETLDKVLDRLVEANQYLSVVVDENDQVVGMLSLGDLITALTG